MFYLNQFSLFLSYFDCPSLPFNYFLDGDVLGFIRGLGVVRPLFPSCRGSIGL
ncbi:hypothetical protein MARI151_30676 [Maribacter litoralis]|uniref:Uncharacterized protein n=1 Tax=Maribacter litoralis TaxID=2059726 RepID=A0A653TXY9_9FLAO|nr:hypothetical protein MARI151_30676 [Maribacter litoralis]